jgi:malate dehydrogenase (oxaloacetate-decarboxylating)
MEGKAVLFKRFADVDAFPLPLNTQNIEEIIRTIKAIAPSFSAINLEDIASPGCYEIEDRLRDELDIPVFHDDQHATAIVVLAATINAAKLTGKRLRNMKVVVSGVGAAGMACCKLLLAAGVRNLIGYNIDGAVYNGRQGLTTQENWLALNSNPKGFKGSLKEALKGADMFLGLSVAGVIKAEDLKVMRKDPIVFALANPEPEVSPLEAKPYVRVMATGGSDYPNQINNVLVFPGIFRGAIDARVPNITEEMKMEAARALAAVISPAERDADYIIPSVFDPRAHKAVADAVRRVAERTGIARRISKSKLI